MVSAQELSRRGQIETDLGIFRGNAGGSAPPANQAESQRTQAEPSQRDAACQRQAPRCSNTGGYKYKTDGVGSGTEKRGVVQMRAGGRREMQHGGIEERRTMGQGDGEGEAEERGDGDCSEW